MYLIEVYGAFHFLKEEVLVGVLEYERIKGGASYRFSFNEQFLKRFSGFTISADLGRFLGLQAASRQIFSCFGDALPDRWGKALIDKRERLLAEAQRRIPRTFDDFGYLVRIDDLSRMGAFRFKHDRGYTGEGNDGKSVPPLQNLDAFVREAHLFEESEKTGAPLSQEWIDNIWKQGSSLGGARPKASISDSDGTLWIAKIPSVHDSYDIALWEHFSCTLARKAGINAATTRLLKLAGSPYHTLLSKRFDRILDKRVHYASSLTLTGLRDGEGAENGKGYLDIVDMMAGDAGVCHFQDNLEELFRRVAFSVMIGNHDDHFRNHGFLLTEKGWTLSPAFDLNPSNMLTQSLLISESSNRSSLQVLLDSSDFYLIGREKAKDIIGQVREAVSRWRQHALDVGISETEQERFSQRFSHSLAEPLS